MSVKAYQCVRPCFFQSRLWQVGDVAMFEDGEWPKDKNGKIRHFELIEKSKAPVPEEEEVKESRRGPGRPKKETE